LPELFERNRDGAIVLGVSGGELAMHANALQPRIVVSSFSVSSGNAITAFVVCLVKRPGAQISLFVSAMGMLGAFPHLPRKRTADPYF
jgi:hypothetical protein